MSAAVAAMIAAMLIASTARAQVPTGTILGTVKDAQGAVVPGASITATNLGTQFSRNAVTDAAGEYALRLLPVGNTAWRSASRLANSPDRHRARSRRNARVDATIARRRQRNASVVMTRRSSTPRRPPRRGRSTERGAEPPLVNRDLYQP
jgi:hypothetical protein